jgi:CRP-like cAMP-binding protein
MFERSFAFQETCGSSRVTRSGRSCATFRCSKSGERVAVEGAGDVFGEIALLHGVPRTATVTTTVHSRLVVLTEQAFRSLLVRSFT